LRNSSKTWQTGIYEMSYYPVFLELEGKSALVVGGGAVAQRKVETLLEYGASIRIVSKELTPKLKKLVEIGRVRRMGNEFCNNNLEGASLVFAATDDKQLNHKISESALKRGLLINAVDQPADCNFIVPAIVRRGDLSIAISTSGNSPALAKSIKKQLNSQFGKEYETFLILLGHLREEILSAGFPQEENSRIFHDVIESGILEAIAEENWEKVKNTLKKILPETVDLEKCLNKP